jgi:exonuclease III
VGVFQHLTPTNIQVIETETKQNRDTVKLIEFVNQLEYIYMNETFHPKTKEYTFFSVPHGTSYKIDHITCHKTTPNLHKKIEITPCILSDHCGLRRDFNNKKQNKKQKQTKHQKTHILREN